MKAFFIYLFLALLISVRVNAQNNCGSKHLLFNFNKKDTPIDKHSFKTIHHLGKGKQFWPLHGISLKDTDTFYYNLKHSYLWKHYPDQRKSLNALLQEIKFTQGINSKDLKITSIKPVYFKYGTVGNLGEAISVGNGRVIIRYIFSKLDVGNETDSIPAWKITGPTGCYFFILKVCGNAFYPYTDNCCKTVNIKTDSTLIKLQPPTNKIKITLCTYKSISYYSSTRSLKKALQHLPPRQQQQQQQGGKQKMYFNKKHKFGNDCRPDTVLIGCDTLTITKPLIKRYTIRSNISQASFVICEDPSIVIKNNLQIDSSNVIISNLQQDTTIKYYYPTKELCPIIPCKVKFELGISGGFLYNTVPGITNNAIHTRASVAHFAGNIYFDYLINKQFQIGFDAGYLTLAYRDDAGYPKPTGVYQTYNDIYLAKPVVPIQAHGRVNFGEGSLTSHVSLSIGYSIVSNSQIENNGVLLTANPNVKGGLAAGVGFGVDYFFGCHFGIGAGVRAEYFNLKGDQQTYNLFAFPTTIGIRYRF